MTMMADAVLEVRGVWAGWNETTVLEDVDIQLAAGGCLAVIGRNGVGKTTLLETIMGHTRLRRGAIRLDGSHVTALPAYRKGRAGLGYVPQEREIFPSLSVLENLTLMARPGPWNLERVFNVFPRLHERRHNGGQQLSGGEQQMLAIARALLLNPRVLLLDEPSEGLAPVVVEELFAILAHLRRNGLAMVLVEQKTALALDFAPRCLILNRGRVVFDGPSADLRQDPARLQMLVGVAQ